MAKRRFIKMLKIDTRGSRDGASVAEATVNDVLNTLQDQGAVIVEGPREMYVDTGRVDFVVVYEFDNEIDFKNEDVSDKDLLKELENDE